MTPLFFWQPNSAARGLVSLQGIKWTSTGMSATRNARAMQWNTPVCSPKMWNSYIPKVLGSRALRLKKTKHILVQTQSANLNLLLHCRKLVPPCACVHSPLKSNQNLENELTILMEHFRVQLRFSKGPGRLSVEHTHQGDCSFSQAILLDDTPLMYQIKNFSSISTCKIENCLFATRMYRDVLSHI